MQKQVQIERTVSFEEICPAFSQIISDAGGFEACREGKYQSQDGDVKDVTNYQCCIVGSAHDV